MTTTESTKEKQRRQLLYWIDEQIMAETLERKEFCQKQIMAIKRQQRS